MMVAGCGGGFSNPDTYLSPMETVADLTPKEMIPDLGACCARGKP